MNKRLDSFDGLRGLTACIIAFVHHYWKHFTPEIFPFNNKIWQMLASNGGFAVEIFFGISGFVISYNYLHKFKQHETGIKNFLLKRIKHLYPLFFLTLILTTILQGITLYLQGKIFVLTGFEFYHLILNFFLVQTGWIENSITFNGSAWCIPVEILCYIIWCILVKISIKLSSHNLYIAGSVGMVILGAIVLRHGWNQPFLCNTTATGYIAFFVGVLLYELYKIITEKGRAIIGIFSFLMVAVFGILMVNKINVWGNLKLSFDLFILPCILWTCISVKVVSKVLSVKVFTFIGKISLNIYLWHFPLQCLLNICIAGTGKTVDYSSVKFYAFYILLVMLVSIMSFFIIEKNQNKIWAKLKEIFIKTEDDDIEVINKTK